MARITSDTANTPTSAGMTSTPPSRSVMPKVKRGVPGRVLDADASDEKPEQHGRDGLHRRGAGDQRRAHQAEQRQPEILEGGEGQATSASAGASRISDSVPATPPSAENHRQMPSASSGWPLRGHGVGFVRVGGGGGGAGDAEQAAGDVAGEDRHGGGGDDGGHRGHGDR
jgi:hypothetical protein